MTFTHVAAVAATSLAIVACATGCGKDDADHSAHATAASVTAAPLRTAEPTAATGNPSATAVVADVDCGPVTDAGGGTRTVVAVGTPAGRVGCTEAINIATTYATTVSNTDAQTIDGWQCKAQPDPATPSVCTKDGLLIGLRAG
ncbi:hypothetical protein DFR70_104676 [Nocardia tenerifensis]|uniref:Subtilisin inhibitor-like n=1 Tax=Nocardia tenerifensis TaxID=228006 RepID=A0A318K2U7_9NOCA|nr:hypothetical protein [Nocardia tenerifensis]PXX65611.1 hypothetical protein DFR70_104676 [Nocardia tenerifensis]